MTALGEPALWLALLMAAWTSLASIAAVTNERDDLARSAARGLPVALAALAVAMIVLAHALWTRDFSLRYVATHTTLNLPDRYAIGALWAGAGGSLLTWSVAVAASGTVAVWAHRRDARTLPWVAGVVGGLLTVLLASALLDANPFAELAVPAGEGKGLHAELQRDAFLLHPPLVTLGAAITAIPFALTVAAFATRTIDDRWARRVRAWTAVSWALLTAGLAAGARWAYGTDGWGAWGRDPVQSSWLLPWLAGAFLVHRNASRTPTPEGTILQGVLAIAAFVLASLSLALTHSGIIDSPHYFAFSAAGATLSVIPLAAIVGSAMLVARRRGAMSVAVRAAPANRVATQVSHVGFAILVLALAAASTRRAFPIQLGDGEIWHGKDPLGRQWTVTSEGRSTLARENFAAVAVSLRPTVNGAREPVLAAELRRYEDTQDRIVADGVPVPALRPGLLEDVKLVLLDDVGRRPRMRLTFIPLGSWTWIGAALMAMGALVALVPSRRRP